MNARQLLATLALLAIAPFVLAKDYTQAAGSTLGFSGEFQGERFSGRFPGFATRLRFDPAHPAKARLDVVIPMTTATLGISDYDAELRGPAFFHSDRYAQARYRARGFRALGDGRYAADGTLSLRGVARPVTLVFRWTPGAQPVLDGEATVSRLQFGVGGGEWADTETLPDAITVTTRVLLKPVD